MSEPFDIKKFLDLSPTALGKSLSIGWKIGIIALLIFTIWRAWFMPKQIQQIKVEKGGTATIIQKQTTKRFLIPFIEAFVEQKKASDFNTGIRGGVRIEF